MRPLRIMMVTIVMVLGLWLPTAVADEVADNSQTLTLEQAIDLALQNDNELKKAEREIDRTKELRDDAADEVSFTPVMGSSYDPDYELSWNNLLSADLTWQMSKKTLETTRDALVLKVCQSYWNVQGAQEKVNLQEKLEKQALLNLQNTRAGIQAGTVAPSQLVAAEGQWQQAKNNLLAAQHTLDDAYNAFNQLVGLDAGAKPVLTNKPVYEPLEIPNLDYEVEKVIENSPSTWLAQQRVTLQKWAADMIYFTGQYIPYKARQISVEQAELDAASAKDMMEQVTRNLYYSIRGLEESYQAAQEAVKMAEENLRVTRAKFDAGMATRAEVVAAEVSVEQAQQVLNDLTRQHAYLKLAFEKPWAASGGSSASSN